MGCRGIVRILLETFAPESVLAGRLRRCAETRERQLVATVISGGEASPGGRFFYDRTGRFDFQNLPSGIEKAEEIKSDAREFFGLGAEAEVRRYRAGQESIEIFFENVSPPLNLLLFGAGYDALPLAKFAKELGWRVSIVDHRPAFANAERLPDADEIAVARAADLSDEFFQDEHSAAVIMTHNYDHDREILRRLLGSKCLYIGALGPKKRAEKLLAEIGGELPAERLEKLHAPVGLDIGANTPEAIALSIAAEIQAVVGRRAGGFLRERKGSIYGRGD
jgi:xanthine/CO dehydrogenase XdhC/CoxF family maturation factor